MEYQYLAAIKTFLAYWQAKKNGIIIAIDAKILSEFEADFEDLDMQFSHQGG